MLVVFHPILGTHSLFAAKHLHKSMALVGVYDAGLHIAESREYRPQVIVASATALLIGRPSEILDLKLT